MKAKQKLREAVDLLYARGPTGSNGYARLLLECIRTKDLEQGKRVQHHMDLHSFKPKDTFLQNRLLHLYARCGKMSSARQLFEKMPRRDVFSWNAMLSLYSKLGLVEDLRELFNRMPTRDSVSYNTVIAALASCGCSEDALCFFLQMQVEGFEPTEYTHDPALALSYVNIRGCKLQPYPPAHLSEILMMTESETESLCKLWASIHG